MNLTLTFSFLALLQFTNFAFAESEIWKLGDQFYEFTKDDTQNILISRSCDNKECDAKKALKIVSFKNINSAKLDGGKNPGAVICKELPNSHIIYLKDLNGNDNSFCKFQDKSMISSSTISSFASKNDHK